MKYIALLFLTACGIPDRIQVDHYIHVDYNVVEQYCKVVCQGETACIQNCITNFCVTPNNCVDQNGRLR